MRVPLFSLAVASVVLASEVRAQEPVEDPASAVALAKSAFEYRDFEKVVEVLHRWLHPAPKILDVALGIEARRLLGVSLFVLDRPAEAREEFAQLLLLDPRHALDPFVVPPPVIAAFEDTKREMRPTLDQLLAERGERADEKPPELTRLELVEIPPTLVMFAPFGVPQFALDQPAFGVLWAVLQVAGLVLNIQSFVGAADAKQQKDEGSKALWTRLQYVGLGTFALAWGGSALQGHFTLSARREVLLAPPAPPDPPGRRAELGPAFRGLGLGVGF